MAGSLGRAVALLVRERPKNGSSLVVTSERIEAARTLGGKMREEDLPEFFAALDALEAVALPSNGNGNGS